MTRQRTRSPWERLRYAVTLRLRLAGAGARPLPDFLILGVPKAGTTSFYDHLCRHPDVAPALRKEIAYFLGNYRRGERWYRAHFPSAADRTRARAAGADLLSGEATPNYFASPKARRRIVADLPHARFIVLFRNPIEQAYSYHQHRTRRGVEERPFAAALEEELRRCERGEPGPRRYVRVARYAEALGPWLEAFPRDRFLLLNAEAYFRDPAATFGRARRFLDLREWDAGPAPRLNPGVYDPLDPTLRAALAAAFAPLNTALYEMIGEEWDWR